MKFEEYHSIYAYRDGTGVEYDQHGFEIMSVTLNKSTGIYRVVYRKMAWEKRPRWETR